MSRMKIATGGRHLWARTIGSTIAGEGVDTATFNLVAFVGIFSAGQLGSIILSGYVLKVGYEVVATPLTYAIVGWLKTKEGFDHFDRGLSSYNPFKVSDE